MPRRLHNKCHLCVAITINVSKWYYYRLASHIYYTCKYRVQRGQMYPLPSEERAYKISVSVGPIPTLTHARARTQHWYYTLPVDSLVASQHTGCGFDTNYEWPFKCTLPYAQTHLHTVSRFFAYTKYMNVLPPCMLTRRLRHLVAEAQQENDTSYLNLNQANRHSKLILCFFGPR